MIFNYLKHQLCYKYAVIIVGNIDRADEALFAVISLYGYDGEILRAAEPAFFEIMQYRRCVIQFVGKYGSILALLEKAIQTVKIIQCKGSICDRGVERRGVIFDDIHGILG